MRSPRRLLALCSPSTQVIASTTLLLPQPLGPTMAVTPSSKPSSARSGKLLKPVMCSLDSRIVRRSAGSYGRLGRRLRRSASPATSPEAARAQSNKRLSGRGKRKRAPYMLGYGSAALRAPAAAWLRRSSRARPGPADRPCDRFRRASSTPNRSTSTSKRIIALMNADVGLERRLVDPHALARSTILAGTRRPSRRSPPSPARPCAARPTARAGRVSPSLVNRSAKPTNAPRSCSSREKRDGLNPSTGPGDEVIRLDAAAAVDLAAAVGVLQLGGGVRPRRPSGRASEYVRYSSNAPSHGR